MGRNWVLKKRLLAIGVIAWLLFASPTAAENLLYDNGAVAVTGWGGVNVQAFVSADDFQLQRDAVVSRAEIFFSEHQNVLSDDDLWDGTVEWWIFTDEEGAPGTVVASGLGTNIQSIDPGYTLNNRTPVKVTFDLDGTVPLMEETIYWFGVHLDDDFSGYASPTALTWDKSVSDSGSYATKSFGGTFDNWEPSAGDISFRLFGDALILIPDQVNAPLYYFSGSCLAGQKLSQTFTPQVASLAAVDLRFRLGEDLTGSLGMTINIRPIEEDHGTYLEVGDVIAVGRARVFGPIIGNETVWARFRLYDPFDIASGALFVLDTTPGNQYVMEWYQPQNITISWLKADNDNDGNGDPYLYGSAYGCSSDYSGSGFISAGHDYYFITYTNGLNNTPAGSDVTVPMADLETDSSFPVILTFAEVTAEGISSVGISDECGDVPDTFMLGDPPICYDIETTADYSGPIQVCIAYSDVIYENEGALTLLHYENGAWVELASTIDTVNDLICAEVNSLSAFAVVEPDQLTVDHLLAFFDQAVEDGRITGAGNGKRSLLRIRLLRLLLEFGDYFIDKGRMRPACAMLTRALKRCDGQRKPNDLIVGAGVPVLADMVQSMLENIGCR